jgi:hypothetical protein
MTLNKAIIAFSCVACFALSGFSQTGTINAPTSGLDLKVQQVLSNSPITQSGYFQLKTTLYRRIVSGVLWGTTVTYRSKTAYYYGYIKNYDGSYAYSTSKTMQVTRPNGQTDYVRHTIQPYYNASLVYLYTSGSGVGNRDMYQCLFQPELNSKVYTSYGGYTANILVYPSNQSWSNSYTNITDGTGYELFYAWPLPN